MTHLVVIVKHVGQNMSVLLLMCATEKQELLARLFSLALNRLTENFLYLNEPLLHFGDIVLYHITNDLLASINLRNQISMKHENPLLFRCWLLQVHWSALGWLNWVAVSINRNLAYLVSARSFQVKRKTEKKKDKFQPVCSKKQKSIGMQFWKPTEHMHTLNYTIYAQCKVQMQAFRNDVQNGRLNRSYRVIVKYVCKVHRPTVALECSTMQPVILTVHTTLHKCRQCHEPLRLDDCLQCALAHCRLTLHTTILHICFSPLCSRAPFVTNDCDTLFLTSYLCLCPSVCIRLYYSTETVQYSLCHSSLCDSSLECNNR